MTKSAVKRKNSDIKKPLPAVTGVVRHSNKVDQMNHSILADIELNRKISLFQKAVEAYVLNRTLENSMALAKAKADLAAFVLRGV